MKNTIFAVVLFFASIFLFGQASDRIQLKTNRQPAVSSSTTDDRVWLKSSQPPKLSRPAEGSQSAGSSRKVESSQLQGNSGVVDSPQPETVSAVPGALSLEIGHSIIQVGETVNIANMSEVKVTSWSSSVPAVARVDAKGNVTGVAAGNALIWLNAAGRPTNSSPYVSVEVIKALGPPIPSAPAPAADDDEIDSDDEEFLDLFP